ASGCAASAVNLILLWRAVRGLRSALEGYGPPPGGGGHSQRTGSAHSRAGPVPSPDQIAWTCSACRPRGPWRVVNSTFWFSSRVRYPPVSIAEWCTKTSALPSSGLMKPKPLSVLNHFTVPCAICCLLLRRAQDPRSRADQLLVPAAGGRNAQPDGNGRPLSRNAGAFTIANVDNNFI